MYVRELQRNTPVTSKHIYICCFEQYPYNICCFKTYLYDICCFKPYLYDIC